MTDAFANLTKEERIEKTVNACQQDSKITANRAAKIYNVVPSIITRRLRGLIKNRRLCNIDQQLLTSVKERTIVKWVIQYYKWRLPLSLKQIRQFTIVILFRKRPRSQGFWLSYRTELTLEITLSKSSNQTRYNVWPWSNTSFYNSQDKDIYNVFRTL